MKKLSLFLAIIMLLTVFSTSCIDETDNPENSELSGEVSAEESKTEKPSVKTGIEVSSNPFETVISTGCSYTKSVEAGEAYPDTYGTELTDGVRTTPEGPSYGDESLSGYTISGKALNVDIDLGFECDKLYSFKISYLSTKTAGINAPSSGSVYASLDGKKWTNIGHMILPAFVEGTMQEGTCVLKEYAKARYIRIMVRGASAWTFLDEVIVIADMEGGEANKEYAASIEAAYAQLGAISAPNNGNAIDRELDKVLVSQNATYTVDGSFVSKFNDNGKMLTDGKLSGYYEGGTWVGFESGKDSVVKIDLGKTVDDIALIEVSCFTNTAVGMFMPVAMKIAGISEDNKRSELGILYSNAVLVNGNYTFSIPFNKTVSAKYIEVTLVTTESTMHLVEEIGVYAYRNVTPVTLYPEVVIEQGATEWGSAGNNTYTNLLLNKTQQIATSADPGEEYYENNTSVTSGLMTDGRFSNSTDIHNGSFFKYNHGGGRKVIYDLEHISAVDKFTVSFTNQTSWTVNAPSTVTVYLSENGVDWFEAGIITLTGNDPGLIRGELKLNKKVKTRWVVFSFAVKGWAGCDELEAYGIKSTSGAVSPASAGLKKKVLFENERMEVSEDLLGGSTDTCLLYLQKNWQYTVEDLLPYLAYIDENGEQKDTMFDSFLFLFIGDFPVGGGQAHQKGTKAGWEWALNNAFAEGGNLMAMEEAAGQVKQNLGLAEDFKYKVSLTLYYPSLGVTNFGDVDGDGTTENLDKLDDRKKVMEWYIDLIKDTFDEQNFQNIELVGYYWFHETIENEDTESVELLNAVADMVHDKGCDFFWIPYFQANGYNAWAEYGFDVACMQPNYVFKVGTPYSNLKNCAALTKLYGMGIEMELCTEALSDINFFKKYMEYMAGGYEYGYMDDCIVMYYQSVTDYKIAAYSKNIMGRTIYDTTYHFIKGDMKYKPDAFEKAEYTVNKNEILNVDLDFDDDKLRQFRIDVFADHGSVTVNNDGSFTYYPETDYTGKVTFSFSYSEYLGWSDSCEIEITVK